MRIKLITAVSNPNHEGLTKLKESLNRFEYDYEVLVNKDINWNWAGLEDIYNWCKIQEGYTHFLYTDGFDTFAFSSMSEIERKYKNTDKMLFSTEKQCFPRKDWTDIHPQSESEWKFLNHGQFISPIDTFLRLYEGVFQLNMTCQEWAMDLYLNGSEDITLDLNCDIFQTIAFETEGDFEIREGRIFNLKNKSTPVFAHGNGRTDMTWIYNIDI